MSQSTERRSVEIELLDAVLAGDLTVPPGAGAVVVFAHGSGSSRMSPRNRAVAAKLHSSGMATLLLDLLTAEEEAVDSRTAELRFDVDMLAVRVAAAVAWLERQPGVHRLPVGLFGASTGAAAALIAAASFSTDRVGAVVSRGGRPDLAGDDLALVACPTLLVVGEADPTVVEINRRALEALTCVRRLEVVPGATHLFEEPGTLERVAELAAGWFEEHLGAAGYRDAGER